MKIFLRTFLILACILSSSSIFSQSEKREELEERRLELQQEIKRIADIRSANLKKEKSVLDEVNDLEQQIRATEKLIRVTNQQANLLTREINANQNKISDLREELDELKEDYAAMIRKSYRSKSHQSRIMFLLSAESFLQAYKRLEYMKQYAEYRKHQGEEIKMRTSELQGLNDRLAEQRLSKQSLIAENRRTRDRLEETKDAQEVLIATIRRKEGKYAAELREKQKAVDAIDEAIEKIIAEAIARTNREKGSESREAFELTPAAKALAAEFEKNRGKLPWPVKSGLVSMHFGKQPHPVIRSVTINSNGVRIDTERGGTAKAIFGGVVSEVQAVRGANKAVMVRHGDYISIYNNLEEIKVRKGDQVSMGEALGIIATSPTSGKTTLHFLLYKNATKLNPEEWIYKM